MSDEPFRAARGQAGVSIVQQKNQGSAFPHILEWVLLGLVFVYLAFFVFAWNSGQTITLRYCTTWPHMSPRLASR